MKNGDKEIRKKDWIVTYTVYNLYIKNQIKSIWKICKENNPKMKTRRMSRKWHHKDKGEKKDNNKRRKKDKKHVR